MPDTQPQQPVPQDLGAALALVRIESKLDRLGDRVTELIKDMGDHETRLRLLEVKPVVTTKMLTSVVLCATAIASIIPVFNLVRVGTP